jgi:CRISPR type III-A-associated RAMP protein Csm4
MKRLKMKLIKVKITPHSSFVTFPKGDTLFGHFAYHTFEEDKTIFENYVDEEPKIIFSDILPDEYLYKPTLPLKAFDVDESKKKEFRKKSWIDIKDLQQKGIKKSKELSFYKTDIRTRNSLNRMTFGTGGEGFDPFSLEEITFLHQPVIYVLYDAEYFDEVTILERLNLIGKVGFGKKGSIGKGHFKAEIDKDFKKFDELKSDYYMTLSPTILHKSKDIIEKAYYNTFNRFGKYHSSSTPFKKPLLMADSGAVVKLKEKRNFIGGGIENGIGDNQSLVQGYSIVVPFKFEGVDNG